MRPLDDLPFGRDEPLPPLPGPVVEAAPNGAKPIPAGGATPLEALLAGVHQRTIRDRITRPLPPKRWRWHGLIGEDELAFITNRWDSQKGSAGGVFLNARLAPSLDAFGTPARGGSVGSPPVAARCSGAPYSGAGRMPPESSTCGRVWVPERVSQGPSEGGIPPPPSCPPEFES
jgi:hypothetical protein